MSETITKKIYLRRGYDISGELTLIAVSEDEIELGVSLDERWGGIEGAAGYVDSVVAVSAVWPKPLEDVTERSDVDASVELPDPPPADDDAGPLTAEAVGEAAA